MEQSSSLLLIRDDRVFLDVVELCFRRLGDNVAAASHPREAIDAIRAKLLHAALIGFGDAGGLDLIQPLRSSIGSPAVVVISGYREPESMALAKQDGAAAYLIKPCRLADIEAAVANAVTARVEESGNPMVEVV